MIYAISTATTNAELVEQVASLYCPDPAREMWRVLDPTYGRGGMWKNWRPDNLTIVTDDFTKPYPTDVGLFDLILFDPPYVAKGGKATAASVADHDDRYGRGESLTPAEVHRLMMSGMDHMAGLLAPGGQLWVKSADYVTSGRVQWGTHDVRVRGRALALEQVDEFHLQSSSPQPQHARQCHARRGYSTLTVWRDRRTHRKATT